MITRGIVGWVVVTACACVAAGAIPSYPVLHQSDGGGFDTPPIEGWLDGITDISGNGNDLMSQNPPGTLQTFTGHTKFADGPTGDYTMSWNGGISGMYALADLQMPQFVWQADVRFTPDGRGAEQGGIDWFQGTTIFSSRGDEGGEGVILEANRDGSLSARTYFNSAEITTPPGLIADNAWLNVAVSFENASNGGLTDTDPNTANVQEGRQIWDGTLKIYVSGVEEASGAGTLILSDDGVGPYLNQTRYDLGVTPNLAFDNILISGAEASTGLVRTWTANASGNWGAGAWWTPKEAPNANNHTAIFGDAITAPRVVFTESDVTVKEIQFDNANTYAIAGHGSVALEADSGNATVSVAQGGHQFQAAVNLASDTDVDVAAEASLTFNNALNLNGHALAKTGDGALQINSQLNAGGGTVTGLGGVVGGAGQIGGDLVNTSATVAPGNSTGELSVSGGYTQGAGGTLEIELASDDEFDVLAVDGSASLAGDLTAVLLDGYRPLTGTEFTVLTAAAGITGDFDSVTNGYDTRIVDGTDLVLIFIATAALMGDANLDGVVDDADLSLLLSFWQQDVTGDPDGGWGKGEFNAIAPVDDLDLSLLLANWTGAGAVPEPASLTLLGLAGIGACVRRRRP